MAKGIALTRKLEDKIIESYFGNYEMQGSRETLELVNALGETESLKNRLSEVRAIEAKVYRTAAWSVLMSSNSQEQLRRDFIEKSHRAAKLMIESPSLAAKSAELFIALRTLSAARSNAVNEGRFNSSINSLMRTAAIIRHG
ncbi:MAG: hypothetical protein KGH94_01575 [Candidatus Micrarchaeota archaeon]|nr:hypothetical protein [Candidatus Micrarchaeota archaeon]